VRPYQFAGGTAVVTGAAGGIGAALAAALAQRGSDLVLLDRDGPGLSGVAAGIRDRHPGGGVATYQVDLADRGEALRVATAVRDRYPALRLLINNAGVALAGRLDQVTLAEFEWVIDINFRATVLLTHTLLPALRAEPGSHLVNMSSVFGIIAPPGQAAYAASKFAVRGFTEALRQEVAGDQIGVSCVHPGGVRTRIAASARLGSGVSREEHEAGLARFERLLTIDPARAARVILAGVHRRRPRILIGWSARLPDLVARAAPAAHGALLARLARRPPERAAGPETAGAGPAGAKSAGARSAGSGPPGAGPAGAGPAG
jgi:short-subunit dehydrogenase